MTADVASVTFERSIATFVSASIQTYEPYKSGKMYSRRNRFKVKLTTYMLYCFVHSVCRSLYVQ